MPIVQHDERDLESLLPRLTGMTKKTMFPQQLSMIGCHDYKSIFQIPFSLQ